MFNSKKYNGVTDKTLQHIVLDAGAVFKNFNVKTDTYDTAKEEGKLLGATQGGSEFNVKVEGEAIEIDGVIVPWKDSQKITGGTVELKVNVLEQTAETIKIALGTGRIEAEEVPGYDRITADLTVLESDYIKNITIVTKVSGTAKPIIIQIYNALSSDGLGYKLEHGKEVVSEITFAAFCDSIEDDEKLPFAIYYPNGKAEPAKPDQQPTQGE